MKIFHLLKYALHGAGNVYAVIDLSCAQAARGHEVYVCSSVSEFEPLLSQHGVTTVLIPELGAAGSAVPALLALRRVLARIRPDIVHTHMMMSTVLAAALRPFSTFKLVASVHNEFQRSAILMGLADRVIGVSEAVSQSMIGRGIPRSRMRTVLNGTIHSVRRPDVLPEPLSLQHPAIVSVAGMHPRKGIPDLIDAYARVAAEFPTSHLYLVGTGPCSEEYKALAQKISPTGITFLGHVDDPRSVMLGADIFALASHAEPAGLVLSEAREAGCAVVASNVGGCPEMLDYGEAGLLVPAKRPDLLAEVLLRLLRDPELLAEMRRKSANNLEKFSIERVAKETDAVYLELCKR